MPSSGFDKVILINFDMKFKSWMKIDQVRESLVCSSFFSILKGVFLKIVLNSINIVFKKS